MYLRKVPVSDTATVTVFSPPDCPAVPVFLSPVPADDSDIDISDKTASLINNLCADVPLIISNKFAEIYLQSCVI